MKSITAVNAFKSLTENSKAYRIIDVRTPPEYASMSVPNSLFMPLDTLPDTMGKLDKQLTYFVICRSGVRSQTAVKIMEKAGLNAFNLTGGIIEWAHSNLPIATKNQ